MIFALFCSLSLRSCLLCFLFSYMGFQTCPAQSVPPGPCVKSVQCACASVCVLPVFQHVLPVVVLFLFNFCSPLWNTSHCDSHLTLPLVDFLFCFFTGITPFKENLLCSGSALWSENSCFIVFLVQTLTNILSTFMLNRGKMQQQNKEPL